MENPEKLPDMTYLKHRTWKSFMRIYKENFPFYPQAKNMGRNEGREGGKWGQFNWSHPLQLPLHYTEASFNVYTGSPFDASPEGVIRSSPGIFVALSFFVLFLRSNICPIICTPGQNRDLRRKRQQKFPLHTCARLVLMTVCVLAREQTPNQRCLWPSHHPELKAVWGKCFHPSGSLNSQPAQIRHQGSDLEKCHALWFELVGDEL